MKKTLRTRLGLLGGALMLVLSVASMVCAQSGTCDWSKAAKLGSYPGIKLANVTVTSPRKMSIHCLRIDTKTPGLRFYTTPRCSPWVPDKSEVQRKTTRKFITESQATDKKIVAAINASFFTPWPAPFDAETLGCVGGLAVSEGQLVSPADGGVSFLVTKDGAVSIAKTDSSTDISNIQTAASVGDFFVLSNGTPVVLNDTSLHARTAVGVSKDGRYVYFMAIDGRSPTSEGAPTDDDGTWLKHFGAYTGMNMDGGGSTTMAWWDPKAPGANKCVLISSPRGNGGTRNANVSEDAPNAAARLGAVGTTVTERSVGNNLGVYYAAPKPFVP